MKNKNNQQKVSTKTPAKIHVPSFLMNFPFTLDTREPNNIWMGKIGSPVNYEIAFAQFLDLYHYLARNSLIYLLPSEGNFQDLVYVANIGAYLPHLEDRDVILVSNYKSKPRIGEDIVGIKFFKNMGYETHQPPFHWEGEADLKFLRDNIYFAGYGIRTDLRSHQWMKDKFDMNIISLEMNNPYLFHLDCLCTTVDRDKVFLITSALSKTEIQAIEKVAEIIDIPEKYRYAAFTNCVRLGDEILCSDTLPILANEAKKLSEKDLQALKNSSMDFLDNTCSKLGLKPRFFNLSEFEKSGSALSCMIMHLNYLNRVHIER